ncbi:ribonuclease H-like domain-containing protein [Favolaschia claudopus]|uniref:Ribonuclease H-like domain-containing protein n=1 Tax=Favolaschia claudopus TaxID=2862362 RepID=A0AAW0DH45_9AGAR
MIEQAPAKFHGGCAEDQDGVEHSSSLISGRRSLLAALSEGSESELLDQDAKCISKHLAGVDQHQSRTPKAWWTRRHIGTYIKLSISRSASFSAPKSLLPLAKLPNARNCRGIVAARQVFNPTAALFHPNIVLVDTIPLLRSCLDALANATSIAVDLEGIALCRSGTLCVVQLKAAGSERVWLVDIVVLGPGAFEVKGSSNQSLKSILEDRSVKKLFFDLRNDSDALFNLFGVTLANVYDLQLLEVAVRWSNVGVCPRFVKGLVSSLENYLAPLKSAMEMRKWTRVKEAGLILFAPEHGGKYEVFEQRPLALALVDYCAQDVASLHELETVLHQRIGRRGSNWEARVRAESEVRVRVAFQANYLPRSRDKAVVVANW